MPAVHMTSHGDPEEAVELADVLTFDPDIEEAWIVDVVNHINLSA